MENFSLAINKDSRLEAFYIDEEGYVSHVWQFNANNRLEWSNPDTLKGQVGGTGQKLGDVTQVSACTNDSGRIQVVAKTNDEKYHLCYQNNEGPWEGWFEISQP